MLSSRWFLELSTSHEVNLHSLEEIIHKSQSPFQKVEIVKLGSFGKALVLDGKIQSTESDEFIYHESLIHPAMITSETPRKILIAGGGEGASIREVLKYPTVERVYLVDLDEDVVEVCKKHLTEWHQDAFTNPKVKVYFQDSRKFISATNELFDIIILDLPEPEKSGPALMLYTKEFYEEIYNHLTDKGIMVTQATSIAVNNYRSYTAIFHSIRQVFPLVHGYWASVPSFYTPWGFVVASKGPDPTLLKKDIIEEKLASLSRELRFYDAETHTGLFSLPKFLREALKKEDRINTDSSPLSFY